MSTYSNPCPETEELPVGSSSAPHLLPEKDRSTLWLGFCEFGYFLPQLLKDWACFIGMVASSTLAILLRLPLLYLPIVLTAHFTPSEENAFYLSEKLRRLLLLAFPGGAAGTPNYLIAAVFFSFLGVLLLGPIQLLRSYLANLVGANQLLRLRLAVFGNLNRINMLAVYERGAGPFIQRLTRDMFVLNNLLVYRLADVINLFLQIVIYATACLIMETRLTLLALAVYAVVQPILLAFNQKIHRQATRMQALHEEITTQMLESVGGFRDIIAAGQFERMANQFRERSTELRSVSILSTLCSQSAELLLNVSFGLLTVIPYFLVLGQLHVEYVGHIITYVGLLSCLLPALAGLWGVTVELTIARPSLRALRDVLEPPERKSDEVTDYKPSAVFPEAIEEIRFEGVGLKLENHWILKDLNFTIRSGELSAIIGQSGAGKTSIFHLLLRLIEPTCGTIWINRTNLASLDEVELRRFMGFIPQNPFMFHASIRENLLVASAKTKNIEELLEDAVSAAQLESLIKTREAEGGLNSSVGYLGMRLSAGERQRVALARLIIQDPKIIIGDEYTANIDVNTTRLIQEMMCTRFSDRTRLVITHELCNARGADNILVLDGGRIIQSGSHRDLVKYPGIYRTMWESQRID